MTAQATLTGRKRSSTRRVLPGLVLLVGACTMALGLLPSSAAASTSSAALPLMVRELPTPKLAVPFYRTMGSYPQVYDNTLSLAAVNATLKSAVLADQATYALDAKAEESTVPATFLVAGAGTYGTFPAIQLMSASTGVVSVLIPTLKLFPGGNADGQSWIGTTVNVPAGTQVRLGQLFASQSGLHALAKASLNRTLATNSCVRRAVTASNPRSEGTLFANQLVADVTSNYGDFALTSRGIAIGFPVGRVAYPTCGRVAVTIPYSTIRPYLSTSGRQLLKAVRAPKT